MGVINYQAVLSTTEPNHHVYLRFRQDDTLTQTLNVEITANGKPLPFEGYDVEFINITRTDTGQPIIEKVESFDSSKGLINYTLTKRCLQWLGKNTAYFSFKNANGKEMFSTQNFTYIVTHGAHSGCILDAGYLWQVDELIAFMKAYQEQSKDNWEKFVEANKEILESIDPGGKILNILVDASGEFKTLGDRLNYHENKMFSVSKTIQQVTDGGYPKPTNFDATISLIEESKKTQPQIFNVAFITDTHVDSLSKDSAFLKGDNVTNPRRWNTLARFKEMAKHCDATVYGGDNCDCNSGRVGEMSECVKAFGRTHAMAVQKRFAGLANAWKDNVFICKGNHDTGKVPYAWKGHTPETCLNSADMRKLYNGTYGGVIFPDKGIAIYRIDTDDYSDALDTNGQYKEYSGRVANGEQGKISADQLRDIGNFLKNLDRSYHVLLVGHIPLDTSATGVWNATALQKILDGFKQGISVTIDYNALTGEPSTTATGSETFDFSQKGAGVIIAYVCGHVHGESIRELGTLKMITGTCAFTDRTDADFEAFYNIMIDKENRTFGMINVGRGSNRTFYY